jgi:hypothetical protein
MVLLLLQNTRSVKSKRCSAMPGMGCDLTKISRSKYIIYKQVSSSKYLFGYSRSETCLLVLNKHQQPLSFKNIYEKGKAIKCVHTFLNLSLP